MALMREHTDLDKKPTWYLFLTANVVVFLGAIITFVLFKQPEVSNDIIKFVPTIVCNLSSMVFCGFFIWLEAKGIMNKAMHFQRKWLYWYLAALIVYLVAIIFSFTYLIIYRTFYFQPSAWQGQWWPLIIDMVITGLLTLTAIGLQRYARFKIDLDIYRRTHGGQPKKDEIAKDKAKAEKAKQKKAKSNKPMASSGLSESIDKQ